MKFDNCLVLRPQDPFVLQPREPWLLFLPLLCAVQLGLVHAAVSSSLVMLLAVLHGGDLAHAGPSRLWSWRVVSMMTAKYSAALTEYQRMRGPFATMLNPQNHLERPPWLRLGDVRSLEHSACITRFFSAVCLSRLAQAPKKTHCISRGLHGRAKAHCVVCARRCRAPGL